MKKSYAKGLLISLFTIILLAALAVFASADDYPEWQGPVSGPCGPNCIYTLYENNTLVISGTGEMTPNEYGVYGYNHLVFKHNNGHVYVDNVIIEDGITSIGVEAFAFRRLSSVTIADSVTNIGASAFNQCLVPVISLPKSIKNIGRHAFSGNTHMTSFTFPEGIESIPEGVLMGCYNLTQITIPNGVKSIGRQAFSGCKGLTQITIPNSVERIEGLAFYNCTQLNTVRINRGISFLGDRHFTYCADSLKIYVSNMETWLACSFESAASNPLSLGVEKVCLNNIPFSELHDIVIPEGFTTIPAFTFCGHTKLTSVFLPSDIKTIQVSAFQDCTELKSVTISQGITSIEDDAFKNCSSLQSITIPQSVTSLGNDHSPFTNCSNLEEINIHIADLTKWCAEPNWYGHSTEIGRYHFFYCGRMITDLVIPNGVTTIAGGAFSFWTDLKSVYIPKSVKYIGTFAFDANYLLETVYYAGSNMEWDQISIDYTEYYEDWISNWPILNATKVYDCDSPHIHDYTRIITTPSTCTEKGVITCTCTCGNSYTEEIPIDPTNHAHTETKGAVASNCKETGFTAGVWCNDCKTWVSGHTVIAVDPTNHADLNENGDCPRCGKHVKDVEKPTEQTPTNPTPTTQSQQQPSGSCKYCGQTHTGFPDVIIGFFHSILALFGLKK